MKFSVLMAVYHKENPEYFKQALESILVNQSIIPNEVVIVEDGPLTEELYAIVDMVTNEFTDIVNVVKLKENRGLGEALRIGLENCKYDLIARMDSDDISDEKRFEKQLRVLIDNPEIDLVGGHIAEFFNNPEDIRYIRRVPLNESDIHCMCKRRNPINHVAVMFRKSSIIDAGNYKHLHYLEDYYLWIRMMRKGFKLINIDEILVYVRTGEVMFKRRSNPVYIKSWFDLQKVMFRYEFINGIDFIINMISIVIFIYTPATFKRILYKNFLRSNPNV